MSTSSSAAAVPFQVAWDDVDAPAETIDYLQTHGLREVLCASITNVSLLSERPPDPFGFMEKYFAAMCHTPLEDGRVLPTPSELIVTSWQQSMEEEQAYDALLETLVEMGDSCCPAAYRPAAYAVMEFPDLINFGEMPAGARARAHARARSRARRARAWH